MLTTDCEYDTITVKDKLWFMESIGEYDRAVGNGTERHLRLFAVS